MKAGLFHHLGRAKLDSTLLLISDAIRGMFGRKEPIMRVPVLRSCGPLGKRVRSQSPHGTCRILLILL